MFRGVSLQAVSQQAGKLMSSPAHQLTSSPAY
jgi:hypothetical protein